MTPLLSAEEMAAADRRAIEGLGIPALVLQENAAAACIRGMLQAFPERVGLGVSVYVGPGNNGADGWAIARRLHLLGLPVRVWDLAPAGIGGPEIRAQRSMAERAGVTHGRWSTGRRERPGVIVDALFGTGLRRELDGVLREAIEEMARAKDAGAGVLAVDIPSGVDATSGRVLGFAVPADLTVTFAAPKAGHFQEPGRTLRGALTVADISVPVPHTGTDHCLLDARDLSATVAAGAADAHKGTFGHVLLLAGGPGKWGAMILAARGALRAGAGLVTVAVPGGCAPGGLPPEVMVEPIGVDADGALGESAWPTLLRLLERKAALALGPGLTAGAALPTFVHRVWADVPVPAVFDAEALQGLAVPSLPQTVPRAPRVLTPHPGEMGRLLGTSAARVGEGRSSAAAELAARLGAVVVLKGAGTVIAEPRGPLALNPTGNPGMATGGSGDVLCGMVGALLARGLTAGDAARAGVFWHGAAGDRAARRLGAPSMLPGDLVDELGAAWLDAARGLPGPPWTVDPALP